MPDKKGKGMKFYFLILTIVFLGTKTTFGLTDSFQTSISFYNGHKAPNWEEQLRDIKKAGFTTIRVFVNRFNPNAGFTVFDGSGHSTSEMENFVNFALEAKRIGLIIDVTFWARYEGSLRSDERSDINNYLRGILNTTKSLVDSGMTNEDFYLDLGNEHNDPIAVGGHISEKSLKKILYYVRLYYPEITLTASITGWMSTVNASAYAKRNGLDILSYHEHRGEGLWRWYEMDKVVSELKTYYNGPVFLDEPACSDYKNVGGSNLELVTFNRLKIAYELAGKGGASQWCLHNHACWPLDYPGLYHDGIIPKNLKDAEKGIFNFLKKQNKKIVLQPTFQLLLE